VRRIEKGQPTKAAGLSHDHPGLGRSTVARQYQDRWQTELFFKALKPHLRVTTFVAMSNVRRRLHSQIWTALICESQDLI
jgi:hypothetical protein